MLWENEKPVAIAYIDDRAISMREIVLCNTDRTMKLIGNNRHKIR